MKEISNKVVEQIPEREFEIIFIDDGSRDNSLNELHEIKKQYKNIKIIQFTRNFGQVSAMMAGYKYSDGDIIINISADLQDPPELMIRMIDLYLNEKKDIVICKREEREENFYRRFASYIFYKIMQKLSFSNMPAGGFDYVLISRRVKECLLDMKEANQFWQGQILWTGFNTEFIPYKRQKRFSGKSRWTFSKKIKYLLDGVMAYSYFPLRLMALLGIVLFFSGILYAIIITVNYFWGNVPFKGWTPIMILILVLSGIQMLMLGIIGEYLWRTLDQVRGREKYIIEKVYK